MRDERVGRLADDDLTRLGALLQSLGHDHRLAGDEAVPLRRVAGEHLARVDSDRRLQAELRDRALHLLRGPDGPQGVVLVHDGDAEHGHHLVADELLDRAAVTLDDRAHLFEEALLRAAVGLRVSCRQPG